MKVLKITILLTFLIISASCSRQYKIAKVKPGQTYIDEAVYILDEPDVAENSTLSYGNRIFIWKDVSLQVNNQDVITAIHRSPASHEKTLQFWKQYYQEENTQFHKVKGDFTKETLWQFDIPKKGMSAIYNEDIDQVTKVILYEAK